MKLRKATLLFLSTLLVLGCTDGDISVVEDDDEGDGGSSGKDQYVSISENGKMVIKIDPSLSDGTVSVDLYYPSAANATAKFGIFAEGDDSLSSPMAEFQFDNDWADPGVGIRLTVNEETSYSDTFDASSWTTFTIAWNSTTSQYTATASNSSYSSTHYLNATGDVEVEYIAIQFGSDSNSSVLYADNIEVYSDYSGDTLKISDDFSDYESGGSLNNYAGNSIEYYYDFYDSSDATIVSVTD